MSAPQVACPECGEDAPLDRWEVTATAVQCPRCGAVLPLREVEVTAW